MNMSDHEASTFLDRLVDTEYYEILELQMGLFREAPTPQREIDIADHLMAHEESKALAMMQNDMGSQGHSVGIRYSVYGRPAYVEVDTATPVPQFGDSLVAVAYTGHIAAARRYSEGMPGTGQRAEGGAAWAT